MFERFTDRARRVVVLAQEEARMLDHDWIGTEHLLLGLVREGEGVAALALTSMGISLESVRQEVEEKIGRGEATSAGHIPFTPRSKKVLELALQEALQFGHDYIGTEHILLGLIREGEGVAAQVLVSLGANLERMRSEVVRLLENYTGGPVMREVARRPPILETHEMSRADAPTCPNCHAGLDEALTIREIQTTVTEGEPTRVKIAYCGRCGVALGTIT